MSAQDATIYNTAQREVEQAQRSLETMAQRFEQTFSLTTDEIEHLHAHAEVHACGVAIELFVPGTDTVFSLGTVFDRPSGRDAWELVAFHGDSVSPQWVTTMHVGPAASEHARRMRGARLVAAIGDSLDRPGAAPAPLDLRSEGSVRAHMGAMALSQLAAYAPMQPA